MNFESKTIEIRDRLTFIPALAMRVCGANGYLFRRGGYGQEYCVILMRLSDCQAHYDPFDWDDAALLEEVACMACRLLADKALLHKAPELVQKWGRLHQKKDKAAGR